MLRTIRQLGALSEIAGPAITPEVGSNPDAMPEILGITHRLKNRFNELSQAGIEHSV